MSGDNYSAPDGKDFGSEYPEATEVIKNGFYVDDLCDSCPTVEIANERAQQITSILANGDFHLAGWKSNDPKFSCSHAEEGNLNDQA